MLRKKNVLLNLKTIENFKKPKNIVSNVEILCRGLGFQNFRSSGYNDKELLLQDLVKMNCFRRFEDHLDFE